MNDTPAPLAVRAAGADVNVIEIAGELTRESESAVQDAYSRAAANATTIVLSFGDLDYMNSSGIGLLVTLLVRAKRSGRRLLACGLNEHYRHIFELTRLDEAIPVYETEHAAVAAASGE